MSPTDRVNPHPYASFEERDTWIEQLKDEYAHLPQFVPSSRFFLLPPAPKNSQESSEKGPRISFHSVAKLTGKRIATANGFARTEAFSSCQNPTGKACSGKPFLFCKKKRQPGAAIGCTTKPITNMVKTFGTCGKCGALRTEENSRMVTRKGKTWRRCLFCKSDAARRHVLKSKYGVTLEWFTQQRAAQSGLCALGCGRTATAIDHDHRTGLIRGILCRSCNVALGFMRDDPALLTRAIEYLSQGIDLVPCQKEQ